MSEVIDEKNISETNKPFRIGKDIAIRSKAIIEAKYSLTAKENDLVDMLLAEIEPHDGKLEYEISVKKYKKFYKVKEVDNIYMKLSEAVKSIEPKRIYSKDINEKISYAWFPKIEYVEKEGKIKLELHKDIKKAMVDFKSCIYYNLKYSIPLKTDYSKRYYYFCKQFVKTGCLIQSIEDLRDKIEIGDKYKGYFDFKRYVLDPSKQEINQKSDLKIDYIELKNDKLNKRKVTHIKTIIHMKNEDELNSIQYDIKNNNQSNIRIDIIKLYDKYKSDLNNAEAKKEIAKQLDISVKTVSRYITFSNNLIDPLLNLLDENKLSIREATSLSKMDKEEQKKELKNILISIETKEKLKEFKKNNVKTIKEKKIVVDVDYIEENISEDNTLIHKIKSLFKTELNQDIDENEAYKFLECAKKHEKYGSEPLDLIKEVVEYSKVQDISVNLIKWFESTLKNYTRPIKKYSKKGKLRFDNFKGRDTDYNEIEKKLLGWDNENEEEKVIQEEIIENSKPEKEISDRLIELEQFKGCLEIILEKELGIVDYRAWVKFGVNNLELKDNIIVLNYENNVLGKLSAQRIKENYLDKILEIAKQINDKIEDVIIEVN